MKEDDMDIPAGYRDELIEEDGCHPSNKMDELYIPEPIPIAIIGMSCRFPDSNSVEEFWDLLMDGGNPVRPCPHNRWTREQGCTVEDDKMEVGWLKCPVDEVDASFFGWNPMQLKYTDPQQRLLLEVAYEALEDAGINVQKLNNRRVGVYTGFWKDDYKELMIKSGFKETEFIRTFLGNSYSASSARLSQFLGVTGPNIATESACSASFGAMRAGVTALRLGEAELCIASAVNLILHPVKHEDMKAFLSPDYRCKTFDASANGFARSEGVASLVLKRLSDAVRSRDRIYGVIRGIGMAQEGTSPSLGTPTVECEALSMRLALNEAQVNPADVDYIEAHGSGTAVGDPIEMEAIIKAYSGARTKPLLIGSVKTNIGHTESVSGIASIIKVLLAFKHEILPPHRNLTTLNPKIDFASIPAEVVLESTPWVKAANRKRVAGISNFGITGGDMHMILEEPPSQHHRRNVLTFPSPPTKLLTLSAKTMSALKIGLHRLNENLSNNPLLSLDDVAYTLNTGRSHYEYRVALIAKDFVSVSKVIAEETYWSTPIDCAPKRKKRICFMFPGQGTQYIGMGKELTEISPVFRHHFDLCSLIVQQEHGLDLKNAVWSKNNSQLESPLVIQVAIFVFEYAIAKLWAHWGVTPDVVVGHSLGEFSAAVIANVMTLNDALKMIVSRCRLVQRLPQGGMAVINLDARATGTMLKNLRSSFDHALDIAAINSASETTVSGSAEAIAEFAAQCSTSGVTSTFLNSKVAFHSALLEPILEEFESLATTITYSKPCCTFISSVTGLPETDLGAKYWVRQIRNVVQFLQTCSSLSQHTDVYVDLGPHPILIQLLQTNLVGTDPVCVPSAKRNASTWLTLSTSLAKLYTLGIEIEWDNVHKFLPGDKVSLPHYAFQRKKFWFTVEKGDREITFQRMRSDKMEFPLLGWQFLSPLDSHLVFVNSLSLKYLPYVSQHKLGEDAVFPGAGYVEMFLEVAVKLGFPPVVRNIRFLAPLVLTKHGSQETRTVFWRETGKVKIFCRPFETFPWVCHSEAELSSEHSKHISREVIGDIFTDKVLLSSTESTAELYTRQRGQGYNFGIQFQTIQQISKGPRGTFLMEIAVPPMNEEGYICHPIVIDSVMQSIAFAYTDVNSLHLPSVIGYFEIISKSKYPLKYVHLSPMEILLIDSAMTVIGVMKGMETMPSTLGRIQSSLHRSIEAPTTPLFEEHWALSQTPASFLHRFSEIVTPNDVTLMCGRGQGYSDSAEILTLKKGIGKGIMVAFKQLGWDIFSTGAIITADEVIQQLDLIKVTSTRKFVNRLMEILAEEGVLKTEGHNSFLVQKQLPTVEELLAEQESCRSKSCHLLQEWELSTFYLKNLVSILKGRVQALELLFPSSGNSKTSAESFYLEGNSTAELNASLRSIICLLMSKSGSVWEQEKQIHILEIGAGTGSATSVLLPELEISGRSFSYTYTDISSAYFRKAEEKFARWKKSLTFKTFNVETCPEAQGFPPNYYHMVVASNVLHATLNLTQTLGHTRKLLRRYGLLVLAETFIPQRHYDIAVGHLDGYWRYKDFDLRPSHCTINQATWHLILTRTGFKVVTSTTVFNGGLGIICAEYNMGEVEKAIGETGVKNGWILFSDGSLLAKCIHDTLVFQGRRVLQVNGVPPLTPTKEFVRIDPGSKTDVKKVFESVERLEGVIYMFGTMNTLNTKEIWKCYLFIMQQLATHYPTPSYTVKTPVLTVITCGLFRVGDQTPVFPASAPLSGMTRVFLSEFPHFIAKLIDLDPDDSREAMPLISADVISGLIWSPENDNSKYVLIAIRRGLVYHAYLRRFLHGETIYPPLVLPEKPFCLKLSATKHVSDLSFTVLTPPEALCADEVEIKVRAIGLNFRDVLLALKAVEQKSVAFGSDVAGIITRVGGEVKKYKPGDAVFGFRGSQIAFPSVTVMREDDLLMLPEQITFEEAVTHPVGFSSSYYGLVVLAKLKEGDNVLIHAATGGVGLHGVQLAFAAGANIFATAGSRRKRAYLEFIGVKPEHIFSSRDASFKEKIISLGEGLPMIDIVLNSITGQSLKEASLAVCREGGKFVELSRINVWSSEDIKALRPDVTYFLVDLSDSTVFNKAWWRNIMKELEARIKDRIHSLKPLPVTCFPAENVRDAITFLQKAKHVGKIVCCFPVKSGANQSPLFNDRSLYLIVGGLGGIGLKVAEWMIAKGAKHIALTGRRPPSQLALSSIQALNGVGGAVFWAQLDVGSYQEVSELIVKLVSQSELPILRGVMNCAGTLCDGGILEQNEEKYNIVLRSKVTGSWNLHMQTKHLPLQHFVMFSSFAAIAGTHGQSNHAAANAFQDALAAYRHNLGLPGTSVNWGPWGEAGVVVGQKLHGYKPMTTTECLASAEKVLRSHIPNAIAVDGNHTVWRNLFPWTEAYFKMMNDVGTVTRPRIEVEKKNTTKSFWNAIEDAGGIEEMTCVLRSYIRSILAALLDQAPDDIHLDQDLRLDSLMNIELRNSLQSLIGPKMVVPNSLASCKTLQQMTDKILDLTIGNKHSGKDDDDTDGARCKTSFSKVVRDEVTSALEAWKEFKPEIRPKMSVSQIRIVLLTGVTGNLGPYILFHLTQRPTIQVVHCLVQASDEDSAVNRVKVALQKVELLPLVDMDKVKVVLGNLARPQFGISDSSYEKLALSVDAVFNIAAVTGHLEEYSSDQGNYVRQVNVLGVREVLLFATTGQAKYIYLASSIATIRRSTSVTNGQTMVQEGWLADDEFENTPNVGYVLSKFVGEKLVEGFLRQVGGGGGGGAVKVFRIPLLVGCSTNGVQDVFRSNFFLKYLYYIKSGVMPQDDVPMPLLPVDICSLISLDIFFNEDAPSDVYNITNPSAPSELELPKLASKLGFGDVKLVDYNVWVMLLQDDKNCLLESLKKFYVDPERYPKLMMEMEVLTSWRNNKEAFYKSYKMEKYAPNSILLVEDIMVTLKRDIEYALKLIK